jgi:protein phosphatase
MSLWAITDKGSVRKQNQDAFYTYNAPDKNLSILLVCDGMGGARAGNVASELAVEVFKVEAKRLIPGADIEEIPKYLAQIAATVNSAVFDLSQSNSEYTGMGTTLVMAVISLNKLFVGNIGDSRAYYITNDDIVQITRDHSVVEDMVARGDITREQSRTHPNKNLITRAVGTLPTVECDTFSVDISEGDYILLCSDGLSNIVTDSEIQKEVLSADSVKSAGESLLKLALERGAPDNVTIAIYKK